MIDEVWKDVIDWEGLYEVSNTGKVKSIRNNCELKGWVLQNGYRVVKFRNKSIVKNYSIHRLVATHFLNNKNSSLTQVNHKDENKLNNDVSNLEWCTPKYNSNYGMRNNVLSEKLLGNTNPCKTVYQMTLEGDVVKIWNNLRECKSEGYSYTSITRCCRGERKTHKGYVWRYADD